ncbi:MAG: OmpH family outer membrane protein [Acidobacteriota bacterium]|nr:MAG: OmpH family outer membrane protein [Acidobacteriota bacterium]
MTLALCSAPLRSDERPSLVLVCDTERGFGEIIELPHVRRESASFNAWVNRENERIKAEQEALHRLRREVEELRDMGLSEEARALEETFLARQGAFEKEFERVASGIAERRLEVRDAIEEQLVFLVRELAEERGAALVFEDRGQLVIYSTALDVTGEVVRRYGERFDSLESPYSKGVPPPAEAPRGEDLLQGMRVFEPPLVKSPEALPPPEGGGPVSEAALALGRRALLEEGDAAKALRVWGAMLERAGGPLFALGTEPLCGPVDLKAQVEHAGARAFAVEDGEGCVRVIREVFRTKQEADAAREEGSWEVVRLK